MNAAVQRINPNKELAELNKYDSVLRRNGFTPSQMMTVKRMVVQMKREDEWEYCQKLPIALFGIFINVLAGNQYLSKKKIEIAMQEVIDLFKEMDLALLDVDDVLGYCRNEVGMDIILDRKELVMSENPTFRISTIETHQHRTNSIMEQIKSELDKSLVSDPEDDEALAQYRLFNNISDKFRKAGII